MKNILVVNKHNYSFTIYPNPAHSIISLNLIQLNSLTSLSITDVLGQEFNKVILDSQSSNVNYSLDISEWPDGLYFLHIYIGKRDDFFNKILVYSV